MSIADKPVYPSPTGNPLQDGSLTLRQYYAGLAMQGILANDFNDRVQCSEYVYHCGCAVKYADALIAELEKTDGQSN